MLEFGTVSVTHPGSNFTHSITYFTFPHSCWERRLHLISCEQFLPDHTQLNVRGTCHYKDVLFMETNILVMLWLESCVQLCTQLGGEGECSRSLGGGQKIGKLRKKNSFKILSSLFLSSLASLTLFFLSAVALLCACISEAASRHSGQLSCLPLLLFMQQAQWATFAQGAWIGTARGTAGIATTIAVAKSNGCSRGEEEVGRVGWRRCLAN